MTPNGAARFTLVFMTEFTLRRLNCSKALYGAKRLDKKRELPSTHLLDQGLHVIQISFERPPAGSGKFVFRFGHAAVEVFIAGDVTSVLEFARVHAQIPIRDMHQVLKIIKSQ